MVERRREVNNEMYKGAKRQKKTKTKSSESFSIRGSWEGIAGPTAKGKEVEESRQKGWTSGPEKNKRNGRYNIGTNVECCGVVC